MMFGIGRSKDPKASANYLSHYHLSAPPFAGPADGAFLFLDAERQQSLDMLQHLTQYSEEVLLVCGELGAGKSTLCQQFLQRAEEHWRCCRIDGQQSVEADSLFAHLARCYEINLQSMPADQLLAGLQAQLSALQEQRLAVLLVDDAHLLSDDALEIILHLAQLEGEHGKLIRLVLFSEPDIAVRLAEPRFAALPPAHRMDLKGLSEQDTAGYVMQRLRAAGMSGAMPLDNREIRQIHRNSLGMPGHINQQAHLHLQQKHHHGESRLNRQGIKLGIAATAIIGTVLGLHGRVNDMLNGGNQAASVGVPERPVVRLSEEAQPWAVVIRDGESIQISCGATGADTVGVRPSFSTAALSRPLLTTQEVMPDEQAGQAEEPTPQETTLALAQPEEAKVEEAEEAGGAEVAAETVEPAPPAQPRLEPEAGEEVVAVTAEPVEVQLREVTPTPVVANEQVQALTFHGQGFAAGSKLALSRAGKVDVLADEQLQIIDSETLVVEVNTGKQSAAWAVQLSTPDNRRSNVLRFQVVAADRLPAPEVALVEQTAAEPTQDVEAVVAQADESGTQASVEPLADEPAEAEVAAAEESPPAVDEVAAPAPRRLVDPPVEATVASKPVEKPRAPEQAKAEGLLGTDWLQAQPADNYTVQLLVSGQQENLQRLVAKHRPPEPLAAFAMQRDDQRLYVLTQGSYPNRQAAEQAATRLPSGLQTWIRSVGSVQAVMLPIRETPAPTRQASRDELAGVKDDAWVWSQDPAHYSIQLAAASSEENILEAMRGLSLPGERVVVQTRRDGRPWYALIYGSFASVESARGTIARLPPALQQTGPWPRSFASLQDEMGRANTAP